MLKFKFDTGNSLKAFDSVCVCGKETGALNKAVKFLCKYLVRESGSELVLGIGPMVRLQLCSQKMTPQMYTELLSVQYLLQIIQLVMFGEFISCVTLISMY